MARFFARLRQMIRKLRRPRVLRVVVVYLGTGYVIFQAADILTQILRMPSWTARFITALLILGFLLAIRLAWVYDETDEEAAAQAGGKPFTANAAVVSLLILIAGLLVYGEALRPSASTNTNPIDGGSTSTAADTFLAHLGEQSVAVLPFTYLGAEDTTNYLSFGMTDGLISRLAEVEGLSVIGQMSVMRYENSEKTVPEIGKELGVAHIVEGSVQRIGPQIRVQAQLVDARTGEHEWASSYTHPMENVLKLQSDLARQVAEELEANLIPRQEKQLASERSVDSTAYVLYLQGRRLRFQETGQSLVRAVKLLRQAVDIDPTYAPAWATLSTAAWFAPLAGGQLPYGLKGDSLAQAAARTAFRLDSTSAEARIALGIVEYLLNRNITEAGQHLKRALELAPALGNAHREYGFYLQRLGRPELAEPYLRRASRLDPVSGWATSAYNAWQQGEYERAKRLYRKAYQLAPRTGYRVAIADLYLQQDSVAAALSRLRELAREDSTPPVLATLGRAYAAAGKPDSAGVLLDRLEDQDGQLLSYRAQIYTALGWEERALDLLEKQFENSSRVERVYLVRDQVSKYFVNNSVFKPLYPTPQYQRFLRQMRLDEETVQNTLRKLGETSV